MVNQVPVNTIEITEKAANKVKTFGGIEINHKEQEKILVKLGFSVNVKKSKFEIHSPTFRPDIVGEADIVEEIIRIHGYNKIPLKKVTNQEEKSLYRHILAIRRRGRYKIYQRD